VSDPANDPISIKPMYTGVAGRAWEINLAANPDGSKRADVCHWIIERADAHPFWHSYVVILFHLRSLGEGTPPAYIARPGATHEFWLAALDPRLNREKVIESGSIPFLRPVNFASQIIAPSDAEAYGVVYRDIVKAICDGLISPDTDYLRTWIERFGDWMIKK
jgi:hypothetical protein